MKIQTNKNWKMRVTSPKEKKMKKNLDANKKKLAEKTKSADALQKSLAKSKSECAEQKRAIEELEAKLAELETDLDDDENSEAEAA